MALATVSPRQDLRFPVAIALIPAGILAVFMGWPPAWPALLLPVTVFAFTFGFTRWIAPRLTRPATFILGLAFGAVIAHLSLWMPFLFASYIGGQGIARFDYSLLAAFFTSLAVGWYILTAYLPQTVLICLVIGGIILLSRQNRKG
jgi:hypothetical protein